MTAKMIVPVTFELTTELKSTERFLAHMDREALNCRGKRLDDRRYVSAMADALQSLTVTILSASSHTPMLPKDVTPRAAFDLAASTELARLVSQTVSFLRGDCTAYLTSELSSYEYDKVADVHNRLKVLFSVTVGAIRKQAVADLSVAADNSVSDLLAAADTVATIAHGKSDS